MYKLQIIQVIPVSSWTLAQHLFYTSKPKKTARQPLQTASLPKHIAAERLAGPTVTGTIYTRQAPLLWLH